MMFEFMPYNGDKFTKGSTYLGKHFDRWYVIQQTSQKGWTATCFSHVMGLPSLHEFSSFSGNGSFLRKRFSWDSLYSFNSNKYMRIAMFNILKTGEINPKEK